jgi:putative nucleotidyltransferase with HDIG domain
MLPSKHQNNRESVHTHAGNGYTPRQPDRRDLIWRAIMIAVTFVVLFILISPSRGKGPALPPPGQEYALRDWIADVPFTSEDLVETTKARKQNARDTVARVYVPDQLAVDRTLAAANKMFDDIGSRAVQTALNEDDLIRAIQNVVGVKWPGVPVETDEQKAYRDRLFRTLIELTPAAATAAAAETAELPEGAAGVALSDTDRDPNVVTPDESSAQEQPEQRPLEDFRYLTLVRRVTINMLTTLLEAGILQTEPTLSPDERAGIDIVYPGDLADGTSRETRFAAADEDGEGEKIRDLMPDSVKGRLAEIKDTELDREPGVAEDEELRTIIGDIVYHMAMEVEPQSVETLKYNEQLTDEKRDASIAKAVANNEYIVPRTFKRGQPIARRWDPLNDPDPEKVSQVRTDLAAWQAEREKVSLVQNTVTAYMGNALLLVFAFGLLVWVITRHLAGYGDQQNKLILITLLIVIFEIALIRGFFFFAKSAYWIPLASGAILLAILVDRPIAFMVAVFSCLLAGRIYVDPVAGNSYEITISLLGGCLAAVVSIHQIRRRGDIIKAGVVVACANAILMLVMGFLDIEVLWGQGFLGFIGYNVLQGGVNAALVVAIVMAALPILESTFKIETNITLLEYSDLNHPLLQRMLTEAPGSYHHSMVVGLLAQNAADSIGANSVLARVGAYYHDIGKLGKPLYFSENQEGDNKHDELSPTMSSRIVTGHVRDGLALAEEYKLPQPLRDIIVQHHGTNHVSFFYQKAKERNTGGSVSEGDFRYPGPRPQTREAAIVMLADSIESTARSLTHSTPDRIRNVADKIINERFSDGQFDECDLTLRDLHTLADVITNSIVKMQHSRVAYPGTETMAGDRPEEARELDTATAPASSR